MEEPEENENPDLMDLNMTFTALGEDYIDITEEDEYTGKSRLRYRNGEVKIDKEIPYVTRSKQLPMVDVEYEGKPYLPPEKVQEIEVLPTSRKKNKDKEKQGLIDHPPKKEDRKQKKLL